MSALPVAWQAHPEGLNCGGGEAGYGGVRWIGRTAPGDGLMTISEEW